MIRGSNRRSVPQFHKSRHRFALLGIGALAVAGVVMLPSCEEKRPHAANIVTDTIFDTEYVLLTFYRLDTLPPRHSITNLRLYIDDANPYNNPGAQRCRATIYPRNPAESTAYSLDRFDGCFDLKTVNTDYILDSINGLLEFIQPISTNYTVGVSYISGPDTVGGYYWVNPQTGETLLVLKLIKPQRSDSSSQTWGLEMKNVYSLGAEDITCESVKVIRWLPGENPREVDENGGRFLHLVGLDPDDDGIVAWPQLDPSRGYLICANPFPFLAESLTVKDSIYGRDYPSSYHSPKYRLVVKYSKADTSGTLR